MGFCSATFITFITLYHSRGNITLALTFGTLTFCIISPIKYYAYIKRQRHEFFRSLNFVSQTQKSNLLSTSIQNKRVISREKLYDPTVPYSDEEWAFAQKIYRRTIISCIGGGCIGLIGAVSVISVMNVSRVSPIWIRFGFGVGCTLFGALFAARFSLNSAIKEANKWEKDGRLKQELKYVTNWMNAEKDEEQKRADISKRKPGQDSI